MPEIYGNTMNFTMFFPVFSLNFDGLRYPVKKSCPYEIITHGSEVCLHSHPLHCRDHHMEEMEHTLEECIWMFEMFPTSLDNLRN